ncbi:hypothetical protein [Rheinheimera tilapiae]|uniref:hypothetical protein n=1 Tax=Rheinheimera tilapiae TaxID=875043 RepID=UPI003670AF24
MGLQIAVCWFSALWAGVFADAESLSYGRFLFKLHFCLLRQDRLAKMSPDGEFLSFMNGYAIHPSGQLKLFNRTLSDCVLPKERNRKKRRHPVPL